MASLIVKTDYHANNNLQAMYRLINQEDSNHSIAFSLS